MKSSRHISPSLPLSLSLLLYRSTFELASTRALTPRPSHSNKESKATTSSSSSTIATGLTSQRDVRGDCNHLPLKLLSRVHQPFHCVFRQQLFDACVRSRCHLLALAIDPLARPLDSPLQKTTMRLLMRPLLPTHSTTTCKSFWSPPAQGYRDDAAATREPSALAAVVGMVDANHQMQKSLNAFHEHT